jgi:dipeptidyl aminopeptidase/acylaminoacyl peptidase
MTNSIKAQKGLRRLWVLVVMLSLTACARPGTQMVDKIDFVASGHEGAQIWRMNIDGTEPRIVYEVYSSSNRPANEVLPKEELALLEDFLTTMTPTLTGEQVYLTPQIERLSLSPDKQKLAWIESDFGCNTLGAQTGCFGSEKINSLDQLTNAKLTYWQSSAHQPEEPHLLVPGIESLVWSPNSRHIAFAQGEDRNVPCLPALRVIDTDSQNIQDVGVGGTLLAWSPDGHNLATADCGNQGIIIRIYNLENNTKREFAIESLDLAGHSISWSSQTEQIAFAATSNEYPKSNRASLYILDTKNGTVQKILEADNESYENPQWSPDGHLIAFDSRPEIGDLYMGLSVVNPESKAMIAQLPVERVDQSWQWNLDSKSILVLLGNHASSQSLGILRIETSALTPIPLPQVIQKSLPSTANTTPYFRSFVDSPKDTSILRIDQPHW